MYKNKYPNTSCELLLDLSQVHLNPLQADVAAGCELLLDLSQVHLNY